MHSMTPVFIFNFKELSSSTDELDLITRSAIYRLIDSFGICIFVQQRSHVDHCQCSLLKKYYIYAAVNLKI